MTPHDVARFSAWARVNVGISRAEFDALTPADFADIVKAWDERERRQDYRFARVCYVVAASSGAQSPDGEPLTIDDFIPAHYAPKKKRKRYTGQQLLNQFLASASNLKIDDKRHGK